ncbi:MAG: hypothetical protein DMF64_06055 [Acidobacteria bacterium]|nr:MAG: hypothetical protein DMF64_06055 [Acidobacteriota bacterium]
MMRNVVSVCALLFLLASIVAPQGGKHPCENAGSQFEATECSAREYKKADAELNRVYQQVMRQEDKDGQARLKTAQLAWIKFRDTECEYESGDYIGGTIQPMVENFCLTSVTNERTQQLKEILKEKTAR